MKYINSIIIALLFVACSETKLSQQLNEEEKQWLEKRQGSIIVAPEQNYPPFAYIDENGFFRGISADYLQHIESYLGVNFIIAPPFHLAKNLDLIKDGEIDIITSLTKTNSRNEYMLFSEPYIHVPVVIITADTINRILDIDDLKNCKIGVGEGYGVHEFLENQYPHLDIYPQKDDLVSIQKLAVGELDAVIADISSASYMIRENGIVNMKIAGRLDFTYELCMACRKDEPLLASSVNKAIKSISRDKKESISKKWGALEMPVGKYQKLASIFLPISILFIIFLIIAVIKTRKTVKV